MGTMIELGFVLFGGVVCLKRNADLFRQEARFVQIGASINPISLS